jgi:ABC-2 type transport system permease protein
VRRHGRLYWAFVRASLQREIEFRANFWAKVGQNLVWLVFFFLILKVFYGQTTSIAGWTEGRSFLLFATCYIMASITGAVFGWSVQEIPTLVRMGTMDYVLVKPVDSQFWVSVRLFNFDQLGSFAASVAMLGYGLRMEHLTPTLLGTLMYIVLTLSSVLLFYSLELAMMTLGIWLVKVENLWVLGESIFQVARFPIDVFPFSLRWAFFYMVPMAFIATVPTRALFGAVTPGLFFLGIGWSVVAFWASRRFWKFALTHYTSASS